MTLLFGIELRYSCLFIWPYTAHGRSSLKLRMIETLGGYSHVIRYLKWRITFSTGESSISLGNSGFSNDLPQALPWFTFWSAIIDRIYSQLRNSDQVNRVHVIEILMVHFIINSYTVSKIRCHTVLLSIKKLGSGKGSFHYWCSHQFGITTPRLQTDAHPKIAQLSCFMQNTIAIASLEFVW